MPVVSAMTIYSFQLSNMVKMAANENILHKSQSKEHIGSHILIAVIASFSSV